MKLLRITVLFLILGELIILLHISRHSDNIEFLYDWNVVKKFRVDSLEERIQKLEHVK